MIGRILWIIVLLLTTSILAAPVPLPKPYKAYPKHLVGIWRISWGSTEGEMLLERDGSYWCRLEERQWIGTWKFADHVIEITEVNLYPDGTRNDHKCNYRLRWDQIEKTGKDESLTVQFFERRAIVRSGIAR